MPDCKNCGAPMWSTQRLEQARPGYFCSNPGCGEHTSVLGELREIRRLLERVAGVLSWRELLQRDPFAPPQLNREQALEEFRSVPAAARKSPVADAATEPDCSAADPQSAQAPRASLE